MGVLKWVDWTVSEPRYFQLQTDHTPVHLALLDEVGAVDLPAPVRGSRTSVPRLQKAVLPELVISVLNEEFPFKELVSLTPQISPFLSSVPERMRNGSEAGRPQAECWAGRPQPRAVFGDGSLGPAGSPEAWP